MSPSRPRFEKASRTFGRGKIAVHKDYELMRKGEADPHNVTIIVGSQEQDSP